MNAHFVALLLICHCSSIVSPESPDAVGFLSARVTEANRAKLIKRSPNTDFQTPSTFLFSHEICSVVAKRAFMFNSTNCFIRLAFHTQLNVQFI